MQIHPDITAMGKRFAKARKDKGFTVALLAKQLGLTSLAIQMVERGQMTPPIQIVEMTARVLGADVAWLIGGEGQDPATAEARLLQLDAIRREFLALVTEDVGAFVDAHMATAKAKKSAAK